MWWTGGTLYIAGNFRGYKCSWLSLIKRVPLPFASRSLFPPLWPIDHARSGDIYIGILSAWQYPIIVIISPCMQ